MRHDILPMLCLSQALVSVDEVNAADWTGEIKWDGWRGVVEITADGDIHVFGGRNGKEYTGRVTYIERVLLASLPRDTVIDGEITGPVELGMNYVQHIMATQAEHHPTASSPPLTFRAFDVLRWAGIDLRGRPWFAGEDHRRGYVERIESFVGRVTVNKLIPVTSAVYAQIVAAGGEGMVVKHRSSRYRNNQRAREWRKAKHTLTVDARVVGFKPGTPGSSYDGLVGAIEFELLETGVQSRCSGFDMELRQAMTRNPSAYIGRRFQMHMFPGLGEDGKPRSPQFDGWRDDLTSDTQAALCESQSSNDGSPKRAAASSSSRRRAPSPMSSAPRMRNYAGMGIAKLRASVRSLETGTGEAHEKCLARGGDPAEDLRVARAALTRKEDAHA